MLQKHRPIKEIFKDLIKILLFFLELTTNILIS